MNTRCEVIIFIVVVISLTVLFYPYAEVEYLTLLHGDEFDGLYEQTNMISKVSYHKVLEYSETHAVVLYVNRNVTVHKLEFEKDGESWQYTAWYTLWAKHGTADEFFWPYYRW